MAIMYPIILALLALLNKVCRKAANPICASDHPITTKHKRIGDVFVKKFVYSTNAPIKKNTILVIIVRAKL